MDESMEKNNLIKGTFILTIAGLITRVIGFFYKIYLSNTIGAEKLGVYQLIFPIYSICFTLYAGGIQTAVSKLVAAEYGRSQLTNSNQMQSKTPKNPIRRILWVSLACSIFIALCLSFLVYFQAEYIATKIVLEPNCKRSFEIIALVFPFCGATACINGYYYGLKKAHVPAATQLLEQIVRVISVYMIALYIGNGNASVTCEIAIFGVVLGEIASNIYNIFSLLLTRESRSSKNSHTKPTTKFDSNDSFHLYTMSVTKPPVSSILKPLLLLAIPLTANHLVISILHSFESILIPNMLKKSGMSPADALSIYGILTGMSFPFILFPSTITNSLSVLLLPTVSEAHAKQNQTLIEQTTSITVKYSLIIGVFSTGFFLIFGEVIGELIFHNSLAGKFLVTLSWLCPFMYVTTTLGSIINGLGKTHLTFFNTIIGLAIRILFIIYLVPSQGISGYLIGLLVSQLAIALLDVLSLRQVIHLSLDTMNSLIKPIGILCLLGFFSYKSYLYFETILNMPKLLLLFLISTILLALYLIFLFLLKAISKKDLQSQAS